MELQELLIKSVVTELRFRPTPRFSDLRGTLIELIMADQGLSSWGSSEQSLHVFDEKDPRMLFAVTPGNLSASLEHVDYAESRERVERFLDDVMSTFSLDELTYLGVRTFSIAAASNFGELKDWAVQTFSGGMRNVFEPFGRKPSDAGWVFEFRDIEPEHVLRIGPMKQEQAITQIFRDRDPTKYPPQFLFVDIDRLYKQDPIARDALIERWRASFDRSAALVSSVDAALRSGL